MPRPHLCPPPPLRLCTQTYVRAHDVNHALNLEKAGATAVVPEILEPSLQLAAAVLTRLEWNGDEVGVHASVRRVCLYVYVRALIFTLCM